MNLVLSRGPMGTSMLPNTAVRAEMLTGTVMLVQVLAEAEPTRRVIAKARAEDAVNIMIVRCFFYKFRQSARKTKRGKVEILRRNSRPPSPANEDLYGSTFALEHRIYVFTMGMTQ